MTIGAKPAQPISPDASPASKRTELNAVVVKLFRSRNVSARDGCLIFNADLTTWRVFPACNRRKRCQHLRLCSSVWVELEGYHESTTLGACRPRTRVCDAGGCAGGGASGPG